MLFRSHLHLPATLPVPEAITGLQGTIPRELKQQGATAEALATTAHHGALFRRQWQLQTAVWFQASRPLTGLAMFQHDHGVVQACSAAALSLPSSRPTLGSGCYK